MRLSLAAAVAAFLFCGAPPAFAAEIDMQTYTCKDYGALPEDDRIIVMAWLNGYDTEEEGPKVISIEETEDDTEVLVEYCGKNPAALLLDASVKAFE